MMTREGVGENSPSYRKGYERRFPWNLADCEIQFVLLKAASSRDVRPWSDFAHTSVS